MNYDLFLFMRFLFAFVLELLHICGADSGSHYLAAVGLGQFLDELDNAGIFIRRCSVLDVVLYLLDKLFARLIALCEHDGRLDDLTSVGVRQSGDGALEHRRMLHQRTLDLKRAYAVAGALDNVVVSADEPIVAVAVAPCGVAGMIHAAAPRFAGLLFVASFQ